MVKIEKIFNLFRKNKPLKYKDYLAYLKENAKKTNKIRVGKFYSFFYNYKTDYDYDIIKFFDYFPLVFIFDITPSSSAHFKGLNFHHLPVPFRKKIINGMKKIDKNLENLKIISYNNLKQINKFSPNAIRNYIADSADLVFEIPPEKVEEIILLATETYDSVSYKQRMANFQ